MHEKARSLILLFKKIKYSMLINIDPLLSPGLLSILRSMGHGDYLAICDANFPAASLAKRLIRIDGADIKRATKAILSVFPLDSFIEYPVTRMEVDGKPDVINDVHKEFIETVKNTAGSNWKIGSMERSKFYQRAKDSFAIIVTTDQRPYCCFMMTKGVVKPDGSVWI